MWQEITVQLRPGTVAQRALPCAIFVEAVGQRVPVKAALRHVQVQVPSMLASRSSPPATPVPESNQSDFLWDLPLRTLDWMQLETT